MILFGATGGTGSAILRRALDRKHHVHALVRDVKKLRAVVPVDAAERVTTLQGDATREQDVYDALVGSKDGVLVIAVGTSSLQKNTVCFDTAVTVVRAACKAVYRGGLPKLHVLAVSGGGLGGKPGLLMEKIIVPSLLREPLFDALQMEAALKTAPAEVLDATLVRPYRLTDGPASNRWSVVPEDYEAPVLLRYTTRADVAACVVDEVERQTHRGQLVNVFTGGV